MSTIAENLALLADTKAKIKASIEAKGVTVGNAPFADYPAKIAQISGGGNSSYFESLAVVAHVYNRSTSIPFECDNTVADGNKIIPPGCEGTWFVYSDCESFDIIVHGSIQKKHTGKCYIKNGDIVSPTISFSELDGDYFSIYWDKGNFDFNKKIEIYLSD